MIDPVWSAMAVASEATEPTLADTEASIGAATLAFAATAPSIGAASLASAAALTSTLSRSPLSAEDGLGAVDVAPAVAGASAVAGVAGVAVPRRGRGLVDAAVLRGVGDRGTGQPLVDVDVLVRQGRVGRADREDVGADGRVDRCGDVGVGAPRPGRPVPRRRERG